MRSTAKNTKLSDAIPNPGPGMFFTERDRISIDCAVLAVRTFLAESESKHGSALNKAAPDWLPALEQTVRDYLFNRDYDERAKFSELKVDAQRLTRSLACAIKDIEELPKALIIALNKQMTANSDNSAGKNHVAEVLAATTKLYEACQPIATRVNKKSGPLSVEKACASLWVLRETITGKAFVRQWKTAKTPASLADKLGDLQFYSPDAFFVQVVLRSVDPEITVAQIGTGLKRVAAAKRSQDSAEK